MQSSNLDITSLEAIEEMLTNAFHKGEEFLRPQWKKIEEKVREQPTKAILIAAGIGYLLHRMPVRSLLATNLKLLWAFAPPAVIAMIAGKGFTTLEEKLHSDDLVGKPRRGRKAAAPSAIL